jgi:hypothetical protein
LPRFARHFSLSKSARSNSAIIRLKKIHRGCSLAFAFAAFFVLTFALAACQSAPSENRATSGEASAAAPSRDAQPRESNSRGDERDSPGKSGTSDRYDLGRDEQRGGHTLDKHVGRTDDQLRERLDRERDISAASTWTDRAAAEETVAAALRASQGKVDRWNERGFPRANLALHYDAGRPIGRTMHHNKSSSEPCSGAVVVLKADHDGGFFVLTTYPEDRE